MIRAKHYQRADPAFGENSDPKFKGGSGFGSGDVAAFAAVQTGARCKKPRSVWAAGSVPSFADLLPSDNVQLALI